MVLLSTGLALPSLAATYSIEAVTSSGMSAPAMGGADIMRMMMGGRPSMNSTSRQLELQLQAPGKAANPTAEHRIPAAMAMGTALPLRSGSDSPGQPGQWQDKEIPEPKGRLLIYRGCAESAGAGQPEIITLKGLLPEQRRQALEGLSRLATSANAGGAPLTSGRWPSGSEPPAVPLQASLVGSHVVASNYAPEIRFQVESSHDFLAPVTLTTTTAGGSQRLSWQAVPTALGYQAMATGLGRQEGDIIMWTSSEAPWSDSSVPGELRAPAAARLVQRGVLLAPERTTCSVSAQAMAAMRMAMLTFTAYGDTLLLNSAKGAPSWRLSLERRSTAMRPLGEGLEGLDPGGGERKEEPKKQGGFNLFKLF
ncbi:MULTISPECIES: hypothetical protein [unclassified Cyanobium]|uniref:hypothetical protein n=1 Tax=unclassified Cyanobium TaxID=2627006 RepID=UPI0020CD2D4E|nr:MULTISPECIES: hypothetical protein [unclassified Cyanobium]MCP9833525.1 hypothetical protein [Cyanobium sp. La Preciosa 7G6]MCP9936290.1 hypothetical protein [Cyanobium sp. Aljojuca 7A6]